jgi:hypothetical protein
MLAQAGSAGVTEQLEIAPPFGFKVEGVIETGEPI